MRLPLLPSERAMSRKNVLAFHYTLWSVGLFAAARFLSQKAFTVLFAKRLPIVYCEWAEFFSRPEKPKITLYYLLFMFMCIPYFAWVHHVLRDENSFGEHFRRLVTRSWRHLAGYLSISAAAATFVLKGVWEDPSAGLVGMWLPRGLVWGLMMLAPTCLSPGGRPTGLAPARARAWTAAQVGLIAAMTAVMVGMFVPYVKGPLRILAEHMDLPEKTLMDGRVVDNGDFINAHSVFGWRKYRPGKDQDEVDGSSVSIPERDLPDQALLDDFLEKHAVSYRFDPRSRTLAVSRQMSLEERDELNIIFHAPAQRAWIDRLWYGSHRAYDETFKKDFTREEREFYVKNVYELARQMGGWLIHHHNFILSPLVQMSAGVPSERINFQYGWLSTMVVKGLMELTGEFSCRRYFQVFYAFYPAYFLLFLGLSVFLLRETPCVLLSAVGTFGCLNALGFESVFLAPGFNPIRHFLDVAVVFFLVMYLEKRKAGWLALALAAACLSILGSKEFGLFISGALLATLVIKNVHEEHRTGRVEAALLAGFSAACVWVVRLPVMGKDTMTRYYFQGLGGNMITSDVLWMILTALAAIFAYHCWRVADKHRLRPVAVFLSLYGAASMVYYVWNAAPNHFFSIAPVIVLALVIILKMELDGSPYKNATLNSLTGAILLFAYVPSLVGYVMDKREYDEVFKTHVTYDWTLDTARFKSTMEPGHVEEAVRLIHKYAGDRPGGIHIISKHDNFIPFLSKKYSAMPFFDMSWFLLTSKETAMCVDAVRRDKPAYLFIDADIRRNLSGDVFINNSTLRVLSLNRVLRLTALRDVFLAVADDYELQENGVLLSVYRRKVTSDQPGRK